MSSIDVDRSEWPLVIYRFEGGATDETTRLYVQAVTENLRRAEEDGEKYISIVVSGSLSTSAANRKAIVESIEGHRQRLEAACLGNALVTTSMVARGLLTALRWVMTMPVPIEVFSSVDEARAWAHSLREETSKKIAQ